MGVIFQKWDEISFEGFKSSGPHLQVWLMQMRTRALRNPRDGLRTITAVLMGFREIVRGIGPDIKRTQDWFPHHDKVPDSTDLFFRIY